MINKKKYFLITVICICIWPYCVYSQYKLLDKGSACPDISFEYVEKGVVKKATLSDYKGKNIILSFWSHTCSSCIKAFPKMEKLAKEFGEDVQIFLINQESRGKTDSFFKKFSRIVRPDIPMIMGDETFWSLFRPVAMPEEIWLDKNGIFKYTTSSVTKEGLIAFINGKAPPIAEKVKVPDFVRRTSLIRQPNQKYLEAVQFYSYISSSKIDNGAYLPIGNTNMAVEDNGKSVRISTSNNSVRQLICKAFGETMTTSDSRFKYENTIVFEMPDSSIYLTPAKGQLTSLEKLEWTKKYFYNYDCAVPLSMKANIFKFMQDDITRFFGLSIVIEKRVIKHLVLTKIGSTDALSFHPGEGKRSIKIIDKHTKRYNFRIERLISLIESNIASIDGTIAAPILDETWIEEAFTIEVSTEFLATDLEKYKDQFLKYGLKLIEKDIEAEVLVVRKEDNAY